MNINNKDKKLYSENDILTADLFNNHTHNASSIDDGTLSIARGGTGTSTVASARNAFGLGNTSGALPIANGGTGAATASSARQNLGTNDATNITTGVLSASRIVNRFSPLQDIRIPIVDINDTDDKPFTLVSLRELGLVREYTHNIEMSFEQNTQEPELLEL